LHVFIMVIKQNVVIIRVEACHFCQIRAKFYLTTDKFLEISMDFDVAATDHIFFIRQTLEEKMESVKQCISYLQTTKWPMIH
jgi:hypothetical protein